MSREDQRAMQRHDSTKSETSSASELIDQLISSSPRTQFPSEVVQALKTKQADGRCPCPSTPLGKVAAFHHVFGLPNSDQEAPRELTDEESLFRIGFMLEELAEYSTSSGFRELGGSLSAVHDLIKAKSPLVTSRDGEHDFHDQLDALVDLSYVLHGTALFHGFRRFNEAFTAVHTANMTKVRATRAEDSKRGSTFDVVKPPGWSAPVLDEFLK